MKWFLRIKMIKTENEKAESHRGSEPKVMGESMWRLVFVLRSETGQTKQPSGGNWGENLGDTHTRNKTQTSPSCLCRLDNKRITHTGWHTLFIISFQTHTHTILFFAACVVNGSVLGQKEQHDCRKRACVFHHLSLSGGRTWRRACVMERTAGFKTQETKK